MSDLDAFNAFFGIFETKVSPHARTLRTTLAEKLRDAFFVVAGDINFFGHFFGPHSSDLKKHIGLFDYLTFCIPWLLEVLAAKMLDDRSSNRKLRWLGFAMALIISPLILLRILAAGIIAFNPLSLIVIATVDLISQYVAGGAALKAQSKQLALYYLASEDKKGQQVSPQDVDRFFQVIEYGVPKIHYKEDNPNQCLGLVMEKRIPREEGEADSTDDDAVEAYTPLFKQEAPNQLTEPLAARLKLNLGQVTEKMEHHIEDYAGRQYLMDYQKKSRDAFNQILNSLRGT